MINKLLIANRGEIAIRISRAAADLGIETVAVYSEDDARSLHTRKADDAYALTGKGAAAYLDIAQMIVAAKVNGCDAIHPGYGFLSENADFAHHCNDVGITFVGPETETLTRFGDKAAARQLAQECDVTVLSGTVGPTALNEAHGFMQEHGTIMLKALAGGGGRGMRAVSDINELDTAYERCQSEAKAAFGNGDVYVEQFLPRARHIEIQVIGDGVTISHAWERECSIQRRNQKIIEIAPSPTLATALRDKLTAAAVRMAETVNYRGLGTFEFLVDPEGNFYFIEANARLQVEHTVTEAVTGLDLVQTQLQIAGGESLVSLGLRQDDIPAPHGFAIQTRINMETMTSDGGTKPAGGTLTAFEPPAGPGLRVDGYGYAGYTTNPGFDSLLAKLIAWSPSKNYADAVNRAWRALCEFRVEGVATNISFLQSLLKHPDFVTNQVYTRFIDEHIGELTAKDETTQRQLFFSQVPSQPASRLAGAQVDNRDPLAVLTHGKSGEASAIPQAAAVVPNAAPVDGPAGTTAASAPLQGTIVSIDVSEGDMVRKGQQLLVMEAMKMEHVIEAQVSGIIQQLAVDVGDAVFEDYPLLFIEEADVGGAEEKVETEVDLDHIRPDLAEVIERHEIGLDSARPEAVAKRRKIGQRTARENVADLIDEGSMIEYAPLVIAAQRRRREIADLIKNTPADGMVAGVASVNGDLFEGKDTRCAVLSYDYTVLAGTQGGQNHRKKDRLFEIAEHNRLPVVFFTEGGGGRPGDTDGLGVAGLDCLAFQYFGKLSGLVPLVGINAGRCFAGNAALLGCCDVVIATENSNIGMGGPAMIEGGGLGIFRPEEIGPMSVQKPNGVVDIAVQDEAEAVQVAKKYLSYFQGEVKQWDCEDQRKLRSLIPENRLRIYDVRQVIETLADTDSVLEIRRHFGHGMITAFARIEGKPVGIIANNPNHLAGAIDSEGADKGARFMQLCDAFDIPLLFLCDTPGIMVGPAVEETALVRHAARMFVVGASISVPFMTIVLRKCYGLGAQAMAGGSYKAPFFAVSWPTGEFGGMGLEGAVKLGYRKELEAETDPEKRKELFDEMVDRMYKRGKAVSVASHFEIDDVIDPSESRHWISSALYAAPAPLPRAGKKRPCVDTW